MKRYPNVVLIGVCLFLLVVGCCWSMWRLHQAKVESQLAYRDFDQAREMIGQIKAQQNQPRLVEAGEAAISDLRIRLEKSAQKASLGSLSSVWSENTQRINQSPYLIQKTRIAVDQTSLPKLLSFLWHVEQDNPSLTVASLRITTKENTGRSRGESWKSDLAITNLIYSPNESK